MNITANTSHRFLIVITSNAFFNKKHRHTFILSLHIAINTSRYADPRCPNKRTIEQKKVLSPVELRVNVSRSFRRGKKILLTSKPDNCSAFRNSSTGTCTCWTDVQSFRQAVTTPAGILQKFFVLAAMRPSRLSVEVISQVPDPVMLYGEGSARKG